MGAYTYTVTDVIRRGQSSPSRRRTRMVFPTPPLQTCVHGSPRSVTLGGHAHENVSLTHRHPFTHNRYGTSSGHPLKWVLFVTPVTHHPARTLTHARVVFSSREDDIGGYQSTPDSGFLVLNSKLRRDVHPCRSVSGVLTGRLSRHESTLTGTGCPF